MHFSESSNEYAFKDLILSQALLHIALLTLDQLLGMVSLSVQ